MAFNLRTFSLSDNDLFANTEFLKATTCFVYVAGSAARPEDVPLPVIIACFIL